MEPRRIMLLHAEAVTSCLLDSPPRLSGFLEVALAFVGQKRIGAAARGGRLFCFGYSSPLRQPEGRARTDWFRAGLPLCHVILRGFEAGSSLLRCFGRRFVPRPCGVLKESARHKLATPTYRAS